MTDTTELRPALRLGIVGCAIGRTRYHAALQASPFLTVVALADSEERNAQVWARELASRPSVSPSIAALLERADPFDALLISSPLSERAAHLIAALPTGKPILCECPFAITLSEMDRFLAQAQQHNALLMPALPRRFDPYFQTAMQQLECGALGALQQIRCHWSFPVENVEVNGDVVTGGWNALVQTLGCQTVDACRAWQGDGLAVSGDVDLNELRNGKPITGRLASERALANLIVTHPHSQSTHHLSRTRGVQPDERYLFTGTAGSMELIVSAGASGASASAPLLRIQPAGKRFQIVSVPPGNQDGARMPLSIGAARVQNMLWHFANCVQMSETPTITPRDARLALEIVHAAYLSTVEHAKISLPLRRTPDIRQLLLPPSPRQPALPAAAPVPKQRNPS